MPVTVPLLKLVGITGTRPMWPEQFDSLVRSIEGDGSADAINIRTPWGVTADWLDERDEPELAAGFRWVCKRPEAEIRFASHYGKGPKPLEFAYGAIPRAFAMHFENVDGIDVTTAAGFAAKVAEAIRRLREDLL